MSEQSWHQWGRNTLLGVAKEVGIQGTRLAAYTNVTDGGPERKIEQALASWVQVEAATAANARRNSTEPIKVISTSGGFSINAKHLVLQVHSCTHTSS